MCIINLVIVCLINPSFIIKMVLFCQGHKCFQGNSDFDILRIGFCYGLTRPK